MFLDKNKPTANELLYWFQVEYPKLAEDMMNCSHAVTTTEPNPYHLESQIFAHLCMVLQRAEIASEENYNKIPLITALLHDIGKPESMEEMPFNKPKPVYSESNQLRNDGKNNGESSGLNKVVPKSGLKRAFRGHEGISFYKAITVVNRLEERGVLSRDEKIEVLTIVSMHGSLFDNISEDGSMKKAFKVFDKFPKSKDGLRLFNNFVSQVRNDSLGRFFKSKDGRKNNAHKLGTEIFTGGQFSTYCLEQGYPNDLPKKDTTLPTIKVLVGTTGSGKSTWLENNLKKDEVIISRDDLVIEYGKLQGIEGREVSCPNCDGEGYLMVDGNGEIDYENPSNNRNKSRCTCCKKPGIRNTRLNGYSEIWKALTDEDQNNIDKLLEKTFKDAFDNKQNMVIDMTNMSSKAQRKWVNKTNKKYRAEAVVFATGYDEVYKRLKKREQETGKSIPDYVVKNFMKGFMVPTYDNFSVVKWVF